MSDRKIVDHFLAIEPLISHEWAAEYLVDIRMKIDALISEYGEKASVEFGIDEFGQVEWTLGFERLETDEEYSTRIYQECRREFDSKIRYRKDRIKSLEYELRQHEAMLENPRVLMNSEVYGAVQADAAIVKGKLEKQRRRLVEVEDALEREVKERLSVPPPLLTEEE